MKDYFVYNTPTFAIGVQSDKRLKEELIKHIQGITEMCLEENCYPCFIDARIVCQLYSGTIAMDKETRVIKPYISFKKIPFKIDNGY